MKAKTLKIKNIGLITDETIEINKPLILFYGEIRTGKTTILNAVRWVFGGEFPADIIQHGKKDATIEIEFDAGVVNRSFYRSKEGETKARPVMFIRDGKPVAAPLAELMRLSSELSALYPSGFGLELLDRGESLGRSIFEFVERAEAEEKTILANIVGERPAKVPENIGVFVVKEGSIS